MPRVPRRIQIRRSKGWRKPDGCVYVGRPTKWGNPFSVHKDKHFYMVVYGAIDASTTITFDTEVQAVCSSVRLFIAYLNNDGSQAGAIRDDGGAFIRQLAREELAGRDLGCWCRLDRPCHADVLISVANQIEIPEPTRGFINCGLV